MNADGTGQTNLTHSLGSDYSPDWAVATGPPPDNTPPETTIESGPSGTITDPTPTFTFSSDEPGSTFECRIDSDPFAACSGPGDSHTTASLVGWLAHLRGARDRCRQQHRSVAGESHVHGRHRASCGARPDRHHPDSPANDNSPEGQGKRRGRLHRPHLRQLRLQRLSAGHRQRRPARRPGHHGYRQRQQHHPAARHGHRRGRQHLALLGSDQLQRGLGRARDHDRLRAGRHDQRHDPDLHLLLRAGHDVRVPRRRRSVRPPAPARSPRRR